MSSCALHTRTCHTFIVVTSSHLVVVPRFLLPVSRCPRCSILVSFLLQARPEKNNANCTLMNQTSVSTARMTVTSVLVLEVSDDDNESRYLGWISPPRWFAPSPILVHTGWPDSCWDPTETPNGVRLSTVPLCFSFPFHFIYIFIFLPGKQRGTCHTAQRFSRKVVITWMLSCNQNSCPLSEHCSRASNSLRSVVSGSAMSMCWMMMFWYCESS